MKDLLGLGFAAIPKKKALLSAVERAMGEFGSGKKEGADGDESVKNKGGGGGHVNRRENGFVPQIALRLSILAISPAATCKVPDFFILFATSVHSIHAVHAHCFCTYFIYLIILYS